MSTFAIAPEAISTSTNEAVASEARTGLSAAPKTLSPWLFYDEAGSRLFEQITELPEYYLTRTERGIFAAHAEEILREAAASHGPHPPGKLTLIELGAGTATKTGILLAEAVRQQGSVVYQPVDVSETALAEASENILTNIPGVTIRCQVTDYTREALPLDRLPNTRTLALYIGSSIGNFEPREAALLLRRIREVLRPNDALLLGIDLVKNPDTLLAAYDDADGVTASFNRNILVRMNRELGADFNPDSFEHRAVWNPVDSRMEMYLISEKTQTVRIEALDLTIEFRRGESIHTENSYKYQRGQAEALLVSAGFAPNMTWTDRRGWFAVCLARVPD